MKNQKSENIYITLSLGIAIGVIIVIGVIWFWWVYGVNPLKESGREMGLGRVIASFAVVILFCITGVSIIATSVSTFKCKKIKLDIEKDLKDITAVITNEKIEAYKHRIEKLQKKGISEDDEVHIYTAIELLKVLEMMLVAQEMLEE